MLSGERCRLVLPRLQWVNMMGGLEMGGEGEAAAEQDDGLETQRNTGLPVAMYDDVGTVHIDQIPEPWQTACKKAIADSPLGEGGYLTVNMELLKQGRFEIIGVHPGAGPAGPGQGGPG